MSQETLESRVQLVPLPGHGGRAAHAEGSCDHPMALICHLCARSGPFNKMARPRGLDFLIPREAPSFPASGLAVPCVFTVVSLKSQLLRGEQIGFKINYQLKGG